ncbi:MAG: hypothetical protein ACKV2O_13215 [Acidimicrobiales bacterium]
MSRPARVPAPPAPPVAACLPDNVITFIVVARHGGMSYARIASLMNRIGLSAQKGGDWHGSTVARVAKRYGPHQALARRSAS